MKRLFALLVATLCLTVGVDSNAQNRRHRPVAVKNAKKRRARVPLRKALLASQHDEVALAPPLLKQLQHNLIDGGYLRGTADGRLSARTRRALAEFQREYHLVGTGALDRATAEALLGRDAIGAYAVASATR